MLARLWRAGELTPVWTPDEEQEAMRDLIRTRKQSLDALKIAKQQLQSFLLRHGLRYNRPTYWTKIGTVTLTAKRSLGASIAA